MDPISFVDISETRAVAGMTAEAIRIESLMLGASQAAERALSTPANRLTVLDRNALRQICLSEMLANLHKKAGIDELDHEDAIAVGYVADLVVDLMSGAPSGSPRKYLMAQPYVTDWMAEGDYRTAGDAALYGYWFLVGKTRNPLSHEDYLHMACQNYFRWYGKFHVNAGYILAERLGTFIPAINHAPADFFRKQKVARLVTAVGTA